MKMFYRVKANYDMKWSFAFAVGQIIDGVVRLLTFGKVATRFPIDAARLQVDSHLRKLKAQRAKDTM